VNKEDTEQQRTRSGYDSFAYEGGADAYVWKTKSCGGIGIHSVYQPVVSMSRIKSRSDIDLPCCGDVVVDVGVVVVPLCLVSSLPSGLNGIHIRAMKDSYIYMKKDNEAKWGVML